MPALLSTLALAFGGYSQVPMAVIGAAIYGRCNNAGANGRQELAAVMDEIEVFWDDATAMEIREWRAKIIAGYAAAWQEGSAAPKSL